MDPSAAEKPTTGASARARPCAADAATACLCTVMVGVVAAIYLLNLSLDSDAQSLAAAVNNTSSTTKVHSLKEFKVLTCNKTHTGHLAEPKLVLARAWFE